MSTNNSSPDDKLIRRVQALNDKRAFSELMLRHQAKVRAFLTRLTQDKHLADDLAQDCFLLAYRKIRSYRPVGQFSSWLLKIAYHCYLQDRRLYSRRAQKLSRYESEQPAQAGFTKGAEIGIDIDRAFGELTENESTTITLSCTFGYSHAEIAEITAIPLGSIKTYIRNGKLKLRRVLETGLREDNHE